MCLQQGRLFYVAAEASDMSIRPLLQFYGMLALAKALVIARTGTALATLPQKHGLSDVSEPCKKIADLRVRLDAAEDGMFQRFNDVAAPLMGLSYFHGSTPMAISLPSGISLNLRGVSLPIRELFARVPGLHELYEQTFQEHALSAHLQITAPMMSNDDWTLRVDDPESFSNFDDVVRIVGKWRRRFPFLSNWRFWEMQQTWGTSVLIFTNETPGADELESARFWRNETGFQPVPVQRSVCVPKHERDVSTVLPPLAGRFSLLTTAISPLSNGQYLSEHSLHYVVLYLLSSLVRYRPNVWVHALSRSVTDRVPADDAPLAIIEEFLKRNALETPQFIAGALVVQRNDAASGGGDR